MAETAQATATADMDAEAVRLFEEAFAKKDHKAPLPDAVVNRLAGRVTRALPHRIEADLAHLQRRPDKRFAWLVGGDGLNKMLECEQHMDILALVGFKRDWVEARLNEASVFKLIVMPAFETYPATWSGLFALVRSAVPTNLAAKILRHEDALRTTPFAEIEAKAKSSFTRGLTFFEVRIAFNEIGSLLPVMIHYMSTIFGQVGERGPSDDRFIGDKQLEELEGTLEQV